MTKYLLLLAAMVLLIACSHVSVDSGIPSDADIIPDFDYTYPDDNVDNFDADGLSPDDLADIEQPEEILDAEDTDDSITSDTTTDTTQPDNTVDIEQPDETADNFLSDSDTTPTWVTDQTYAGLEWSLLSENEMRWQKAMDYCVAMGARLPNINELRKIIINCPESTYGGACKVSDPDCLSPDDCWSDDCWCDGNAGSYSALGDGKLIWLWSSSPQTSDPDGTWSVAYGTGNVYDANKYGGFNHARCVR